MKATAIGTVLLASVIFSACSGDESLAQIVDTMKSTGGLVAIENKDTGYYRFASPEKEKEFLESVLKLGITVDKQTTTKQITPDNLAVNNFTGPTSAWDSCFAEITQLRIDTFRLYKAKTVYPTPHPTDRERIIAKVALPDTVGYYERSSSPSSGAFEAVYPSGVFVEGNYALSSKHQCGSYKKERACNWFRCWDRDNYWWSSENTLTPPPI